MQMATLYNRQMEVVSNQSFVSVLYEWSRIAKPFFYACVKKKGLAYVRLLYKVRFLIYPRIYLDHVSEGSDIGNTVTNHISVQDLESQGFLAKIPDYKPRF